MGCGSRRTIETRLAQEFVDPESKALAFHIHEFQDVIEISEGDAVVLNERTGLH